MTKLNLITDGKALDVAIAALLNARKRLNVKFHEVLASALVHVAKHGNPACLQRLYDGLGNPKAPTRVTADQRQMTLFVGRMNMETGGEIIGFKRKTFTAGEMRRVAGAVDKYETVVRNADNFTHADPVTLNRVLTVNDGYVLGILARIKKQIDAGTVEGKRIVNVDAKTKVDLDKMIAAVDIRASQQQAEALDGPTVDDKAIDAFDKAIDAFFASASEAKPVKAGKAGNQTAAELN